jgi:hypothetical protein
MKEKNENAVAMGKLGGKKRWSKISKKKRSEEMSRIAKIRHSARRELDKLAKTTPNRNKLA